MPSSTDSEILPSQRAHRRRQQRLVMAATAPVVVVVVVVVAIVVLRRGDGSWAFDAAERGNELVADDRTVCGTDGGVALFCLEGATGEELFTEHLADRLEPFTIVDGTVLVGRRADGSAHARLSAYSVDGDQLWDAPLDDATVSEIPVADGVVAIQKKLGSEMVGLDLVTGQERWRTSLSSPTDTADQRLVGHIFTDGEGFYASVVPDGPRSSGHVVAIEPGSGTERWRARIAGPDLPSTAIAPFDDGGAVVFVVGEPSRHQRLVVLDTTSGQLHWQAPLTDDRATVAHLDGVTVVSFGAEMRGYSSGGDELWTTDAPTGSDGEDAVGTSPGRGRLFVAGATLYYHASEVHAVDPRTGESRTVIDDRVDEVVATADHLVTAGPCCATSPHIEGHPLERGPAT